MAKPKTAREFLPTEMPEAIIDDTVEAVIEYTGYAPNHPNNLLNIVRLTPSHIAALQAGKLIAISDGHYAEHLLAYEPDA